MPFRELPEYNKDISLSYFHLPRSIFRIAQKPLTDKYLQDIPICRLDKNQYACHKPIGRIF